MKTLAKYGITSCTDLKYPDAHSKSGWRRIQKHIQHALSVIIFSMMKLDTEL